MGLEAAFSTPHAGKVVAALPRVCLRTSQGLRCALFFLGEQSFPMPVTRRQSLSVPVYPNIQPTKQKPLLKEARARNLISIS